MFHLSPSILAADFTRLGEQVKQVEETGADWIHLDVMDGDFVPSISFGMPVIKSLRKETKLFFDVHLMVREPIRYVKEFRDCGAEMITVHVEACSDVEKTIQSIHETGAKAGLALNPKTPVELIRPWVDKVDMILVMSVEPGFGGQKFIEPTLEKMRAVHEMIEQYHPDCDLEVDGGIHLQNVSEVLDAGVNVIVAGTAVFKGNIGQNVMSFTEAFNDCDRRKNGGTVRVSD